jgi:hypothetical protein
MVVEAVMTFLALATGALAVAAGAAVLVEAVTWAAGEKD